MLPLQLFFRLPRAPYGARWSTGRKCVCVFFDLRRYAAAATADTACPLAETGRFAGKVERKAAALAADSSRTHNTTQQEHCTVHLPERLVIARSVIAPESGKICPGNGSCSNAERRVSLRHFKQQQQKKKMMMMMKAKEKRKKKKATLSVCLWHFWTHYWTDGTGKSSQCRWNERERGRKWDKRPKSGHPIVTRENLLKCALSSISSSAGPICPTSFVISNY